MKNLLSARANFPKIPKRGKATYISPEGRVSYSFALMSDIQAAVDPVLAENDLMWVSCCKDNMLTVSIIDTVGKTVLESSCPLPDATDYRVWGAEKTYKERHLLKGLLGLNIEDESEEKPGEEKPGDDVPKSLPVIPDDTVKSMLRRISEGQEIDIVKVRQKYVVSDDVEQQFVEARKAFLNSQPSPEDKPTQVKSEPTELEKKIAEKPVEKTPEKKVAGRRKNEAPVSAPVKEAVGPMDDDIATALESTPHPKTKPDIEQRHIDACMRRIVADPKYDYSRFLDEFNVPQTVIDKWEEARVPK